jgi:hypothetical protein
MASPVVLEAPSEAGTRLRLAMQLLFEPTKS